MDKACAVHGQQLPPTSCTNMDARRKTQERQTQRDTEKDSGEEEKDDGFSLMG